MTLQLCPENGKPSFDFLTKLIPPVALYLTGALVLSGVFRTPWTPLSLLPGAALVVAAALCSSRSATLIRLAAAAAGTLLFLLVSPVREGGAALANRLFAVSESANAYAYRYFPVSEAAAPLAAQTVAAILLAVVSSAADRRRGMLIPLFLGVTALEAYFGVSAGVWRNLLFFAALLWLLAGGETRISGGMTALLLFAAVILAVFLLAPRPDPVVETRSEMLRDELSQVVSGVSSQTRRTEEETGTVHAESRQHEEAAVKDDAPESRQTEFRRETETEREISLPHRRDYLRMALWLLLAILLLTGPFLPFLLINRAKKRMEQRREAFRDPDPAPAIRAIFACVMAWLGAFGLNTDNRPYSQCVEDVSAIMSPAYAQRFMESLRIWQEAAYSDHALSEEKRAKLLSLLEETEASLYTAASPRKRLRLKYVDCLYGG